MIALLLFSLIQDVSFEERKLATRPEGTAQTDSWFSPDGRSVAWVEYKDPKFFVMVNDRRHEEVDDVVKLKWRPDGKQVAYAARFGKKEWRVVAGEGKGDAFEDIRELDYSPDGKVLAYEAKQGNVHRMVVNGKAGDPYDAVGLIEFGPEGRYAYSGRKGDDWFLVSNEKTVGPFDDVDVYKFHGRMLCYQIRRKDKRFFMAGEKLSGPFDEIGAYWAAPDGARLILGVRSGSVGYLVTDGVKNEGLLSHVQEIVVGGVDGKTVAYWAGDRKTSRIYMGDWKSPEIKAFGLGFLTVAPDGKSAAAQVVREDEQRVWHGELGESFNQVGQLKFSPKGEVCYRAHHADGRDYLVIGRRRVFDCVVLWKYEFTASGVLVAAADPVSGKGSIRVGDQVHGPYDAPCDTYVLSPDGKKLAFGATVGRDLWWKVVPVD